MPNLEDTCAWVVSIILVMGLCCAMLIYLLAKDVPDDSLGYVIANGAPHPL
jgi:hypothetical protein